MVAKLELANLSYPMMSCSAAKSCVQVTIPDILEQIFYNISVPKHQQAHQILLELTHPSC